MGGSARRRPPLRLSVAKAASSGAKATPPQTWRCESAVVKSPQTLADEAAGRVAHAAVRAPRADPRPTQHLVPRAGALRRDDQMLVTDPAGEYARRPRLLTTRGYFRGAGAARSAARLARPRPRRAAQGRRRGSSASPSATRRLRPRQLRDARRPAAGGAAHARRNNIATAESSAPPSTAAPRPRRLVVPARHGGARLLVHARRPARHADGPVVGRQRASPPRRSSTSGRRRRSPT